MTVLPQLERQLIRAAERATETHQQQAGGRSAHARTVADGFALVMAAAVTIVIGVGALILLGSHKPLTAGRAGTPGRQQLTAILGVLRRPQTKADLNQKVLSQLPSGLAFQGKPDLPLVRFATTTPWGERLYFVPIKPLTAQQLASLQHRFPHLAARDLANLRTQGETLSVFSSQGGGGASTVATIQAGKAMAFEGAGRAFAGGATRTKLILVVPDGVAKVQFVLPRQPQPGVPGTHIYPSSNNVTVRVHDNIAAAEVPRNLPGVAVPMIWYSPNGAVLHRFGNLAAVNRVVAPPQPGPETQQSRAAERNPSTPNRVWVTPVVGGPHTKFLLHFRVLLNGADYHYRLTGTRCPAITLNGGDGGGGALGLRGRIWTDAVDAVDGQTWCPGTYHLSATVMDLGSHGSLTHPATAFGTATFTVRR